MLSRTQQVKLIRIRVFAIFLWIGLLLVPAFGECVKQPVAPSDESQHPQPGGPCAPWALFFCLLPNMCERPYSIRFSRKAVNTFIKVSSNTKTDSSNTNRQGFKRPSRFFFHNSSCGAAPLRSGMQMKCLKSAYNGSVKQKEQENMSPRSQCLCTALWWCSYEISVSWSEAIDWV